MTEDSRPRPQYGEYATPEMQAKAMGRAHPPALPPEAAIGLPVDPIALPAPQQPGAEVRERTHPGQLNRFVTIVLLALGLLNVVTSTAGFLDLPTTLQTVYTQMDFGTYTSVSLASALGIVVAVTQIVLWLATAGVSILLLNRGRRAWWVPLVGGAVWVVAMMVILLIAMFSDPALSAYIGATQ